MLRVVAEELMFMLRYSSLENLVDFLNTFSSLFVFSVVVRHIRDNDRSLS